MRSRLACRSDIRREKGMHPEGDPLGAFIRRAKRTVPVTVAPGGLSQDPQCAVFTSQELEEGGTWAGQQISMQGTS